MLREDDYAAIISDHTIRSAINRAAEKVGADHETRDLAARYLSDAIIDHVREIIDRLAGRALTDAQNPD